MKIALCTDGVFPFAFGGMQRHSRKLAEHLCLQQDVELIVLHPHDRTVFDPSLAIREIPIPPIDERSLYLQELWRYSSRIDAALRELRPDVIISQGFSVWAGIENWRDRLIVHPHGLEMFQTITLKEFLVTLPFRYVLRRIMRQSAVVISLGGKLTNIIEEQVKGSAVRIEILPNAVDPPESLVAYPVNKPIELLFVGRFAFNKGIDLLVEAARHFDRKRSDVRFILAGDGPLMAGFKEQGLPSNMELLGKVGDDVLRELYGRCHALVLPTRFEGMPTVVLEAMANARPVIVSDVGATAELVKGSNGLLIEKGKASSLIAAIEEFIGLSVEERSQMGRNGSRKVQERYTWPVVARRSADLARELMERYRLKQQR